MGTNFTRFKCILATLLLCIVSVSAWGQYAGTGTFTKITTLEEITSGSYYVFYGVNGNYSGAMNNTISSGRMGNLAITIENNKIVDPATSCVWVISGNSTDGYTIYNEAASKYCEITTNSTSGFAFNASSGHTFDVSLKSTGNFFFKSNSSNSGSRGVSIYQTDWRPYVVGSANTLNLYKFIPSSIATPVFAPSGGEFEGSQIVTITCETQDVQIYYTIDESDPTNQSSLYNPVSGIEINKSTTIKAIAYKNDESSEIATAIYTKKLPAPVFAYSSLEAVAIMGKEFVAPVLSYNGNTDLAGLSISYESSDLSVATINELTGEIEVLSPGITTITALVDETPSYAASAATYDLTVKALGQMEFCNYGDFTGWPTSAYADKKVYTVGELTWNYTGIYKQSVNDGFLQIRSSATNAELTTPIFSSNISVINLAFTQGSGTINITDMNDNVVGYGDFSAAEGASINIMSKNLSQVKIKINNGGSTTRLSSLEITGSSISKSQSGAMVLMGEWTKDEFDYLDFSATDITSIDLTKIEIPVGISALTIGNPNCLIYVKEADEDITSTWKNVIIGDVAYSIALEDGYPFYNTKEFEALEVSFKRDFTHMAAEGWASLFLPFPVSSSELGDIYIEKYNRISPTENIVYFDEATAIEANTPYIVRIKTGEVKTFTGSGVIPKTPEVDDQTAGFKGTYTEIPRGEATGLYLLKADGSAFAVATETASVPAFRAYIKYTGPSGAKPNFAVGHDGGGTTGCKPASVDGELYIYSVNGCVEINATKAQVINICALDGRIVKTMEVVEGCNIVTDLAKGVYLLNNRKFIVK